MEIIIAKTAGFCFGVKRALEMVRAALDDQDTPISSLGPLIHNPEVVRQLEAKGLQMVESIHEVTTGRVVIRSHGVGPGIYKHAAGAQLEVIDATCPFVKNVQELGVKLREQGYQVIIVGEREHAEVKGVLESVSGEALVVNDVTELEPEKLASKVGIISQTTQNAAKLQQIVAAIIPVTKETRIYNTICLATSQRQNEAAELSQKVELMIVVGGKNSANTCRLAEICRQHGTTTYQVESEQELDLEWFVGINRVGITAGASTPDEQIIGVVNRIKTMGGNEAVVEETKVEQEQGQVETANEVEQFNLDWPDDRFKELVEGEIIEAKVILVRDDSAFVDIGGKSDLIIPLEELAVEPGVSAKQLVKTGDVIKVMVTRTGDEDKIRLSKRLVDQEQVWFNLEAALAKGTTVSGTIAGVVKGGLSVNVSGLKAFMPASQATLGFQKDLSELVGQTFPVAIIEIDRSKRRLLVSRRSLLEKAKQQAESEIYDNLQEGTRKSGTVTRITDFGAFVDLGSGIEGLIHVSELSWNRVKSAREILKEGDQVEVLVLKVDREAKRISLSLRQIAEHPWDKAAQNFVEDQVYPGTVVRLETFGAFVRLAPGVDGLVHVSQISDKRIAKPEEVLKIGDEVQAKVIKVDTANRKISLSLKQVTQDQNDAELNQYLDGQNMLPVTQSLADLIKK